MRERRLPSAAVAVIRAWVDEERPDVVKIRVSRVAMEGEPPQELGATTSIRDALVIVEDWLTEFAHEHREGRGGR